MRSLRNHPLKNKVDLKLFDFCVYDEILSDDIFSRANQNKPLEKFSDPFHFTNELGDIALNYMLLNKKVQFGFGVDLLTLPDGFKYIDQQDKIFQQLKKRHIEEFNLLKAFKK